jgi:hypothetical protein
MIRQILLLDMHQQKTALFKPPRYLEREKRFIGWETRIQVMIVKMLIGSNEAVRYLSIEQMNEIVKRIFAMLGTTNVAVNVQQTQTWVPAFIRGYYSSTPYNL